MAPPAPAKTPIQPGPGGKGRRLFWAALITGMLLHFGAGIMVFGLASSQSDQPARLAADWLHAPDAWRYHYDAWKVELFRSLDLNISNPLGRFSVERFTMVVNAFYAAFWAHPLVMTALQSLLMLAAALLIRRLALRAGQPPARARMLALLAMYWPTTFIWAALPMKEIWALCAGLMLLAAMAEIMARENTKAAVAAWSLGLAASVFLLVFIRFYFWKILLVLAPCFLVAMAAAGRLQGLGAMAPRLAWAGALLAAALALGMPYNREFGFVFGQPPPAGSAPSHQAMADPERKPAKGLNRIAPTVDEAMVIRRRFEKFSGSSMPEDRLESRWRGPAHLLGQLARGLRDFIFFPRPWERWPRAESWGYKQAGVCALGVLWYALLPGLAWGVLNSLRRPSPAGWVVLLWGGGLSLALGLVVLNLGTVFRLRDMAVLPMLTLFDPSPYRWLWRKIAFRRGGAGACS